MYGIRHNHPESQMARAKGALRNRPIILSLSKEIGRFLSSLSKEIVPYALLENALEHEGR
jgi:hypothetical protein